MSELKSRVLVVSVLLVILSLAPLIPHASSADAPALTTASFTSDTGWQVYDSDPATGPANLLGNAQFVCLNSFYPSRCPVGATLYGWPASGWFADLSSIPDAYWIWAPNVTGDTGPAELTQFYFSQSFQLSGTPVSGSMMLAVDDFAEVRVNGVIVGSSGSTTDNSLAVRAQQYLRMFDLTSYLTTGTDTITIRAVNGIFGVCCPSTYSGNPAGVVFGGSLTFQPGLAVNIDVKPGSDMNPINVVAQGDVPVAILGSASFNASSVDASTVRFGKTGTEAASVRFSLADINLDGQLDMVLHFSIKDTGFHVGDTQGVLTGSTTSGVTIRGSDVVTTLTSNASGSGHWINPV